MAKRFNDKEKKKIFADYIECGNYSEVARKWKTSKQTIIRVVKSFNNTELEQKLTQKKEENTKSTLEYMEEQHETKKRLLDKLLKGMEVKADEIDMFTNIKDLATAYGIILDKELKVKEIDQKINDGSSITEINNNITNIANLINNPVDNRNEDTIDEVQNE